MDLTDLDAPYNLTQEQVEFFKQHGFIRLKNVLNSATLAHFSKAIADEVSRADHTPLEDDDAYAAAFVQVINLWVLNETVRKFVFGKRLARIAADLLEVKGVRLYHDQALFKAPGGGPTPWHADHFYWPLATDKTITAWVPLVPVPDSCGPLEFAACSHTHDLGRSIGIGSDSDAQITERVESGGFQIMGGAFELGEVSFHSGWTFHRANGNSSNNERKVMTMIFFDKDAVMAEPQNDNQRLDWERYLKDVQPGQVCSGPLTPVVWERC